MKVDSVHNFNQNILFKNRYGYMLNQVVSRYNRLTPEEIKLIEKNGLNQSKIKGINDIISSLNSALVLDKWEKYNKTIMARILTPTIFEIGETCKVFLNTLIRGTRFDIKHFEWVANDISDKNLNNEIYTSEIIKYYKEQQKHMKVSHKQDLYKSQTIEKLYSPEYKIKPQNTEHGYLTTIINKKTGKPEKAYIDINARPENQCSTIFLNIENDFNHPSCRILGNQDKSHIRNIGTLDFYNKNGNYEIINIRGGAYSPEEYGGVSYRLIQALIEYSLQNNIKDIITNIDAKYLPIYSKAGFRVNPAKDELLCIDHPAIMSMLKGFYEMFDIPKEQLVAALKIRTKDGVSGYSLNETQDIFNKLLYQKNKYMFYNGDRILLELTPQAKQEWLERIKSQPILT